MQTRLELYQRVTPLANLGIWEYQFATGETYWNAIMWDIYEMPPQPDALHERLATLYRDHIQFNQLISETIETLQPRTGEFQITTALGNLKWVRLRTNATGNPSGCLTLYGTLEDITATKLLEEERENNLQLLNEQNSRLSNFAHIVSHNLRTHTGNIKMLAELIPLEEDEQEKSNMQDLVFRQAVYLLETLDQLSEVVDVNSNSFNKIEYLNLHRAVQSVLQMLEQTITQQGVTVSLKIDESIRVKHKAAYLESIITNLITNAVKYRSLERPCKIDIKATNGKNQVVLEVKDNGIGIDLSKHGRQLFGLYNTFHGNSDAHGIGLHLVKSQVEALGGQISVESNLGEGSVFSVVFSH
jgi:signal transduction histidine kinase